MSTHIDPTTAKTTKTSFSVSANAADLLGAAAAAVSSSPPPPSPSSSAASEQTSKKSQKGPSPLEQLQNDEARQRRSLQNEADRDFESTLEQEQTAPSKIKFDAEEYQFWATGRKKKTWRSDTARGQGGWKRKRETLSDEEMNAEGAEVFGRMARHLRKGGGHENETFEVEGAQSWAGGKVVTGFTAAAHAVSLLVRPQDVIDIVELDADEGEGGHRHICGRRGGSGGDSDDDHNHDSEDEEKPRPPLKTPKLLVEMLIAIRGTLQTKEEDDLVLLFDDASGSDEDGEGQIEVYVDELQVCMLLVRILFVRWWDLCDGTLICCDLGWMLLHAEEMIKRVIRHYEMILRKGKQPRQNVELAWLYTRLLQLRKYEETSHIVWLKLWIAIDEEGLQSSGNNDLSAVGERIFAGITSAECESPEAAEAARVFSFRYLRHLCTAPAHKLWFSDPSGREQILALSSSSSSSKKKIFHAKDVVTYIAKFIGSDDDDGEGPQTVTVIEQRRDMKSTRRPPPDVLLRCAHVMEAFDMGVITIDEEREETVSLPELLSMIPLDAFNEEDIHHENCRRLLVLRAALQVSQVADDSDELDAIKIFRAMNSETLDEHWATSDPFAAFERQKQRQTVNRDCADEDVQIRFEEEGVVDPFFFDYKAWLLTLPPLFRQQKLDLEQQQIDEFVELCDLYGREFEEECVERGYRAVVDPHNRRVREKFRRLLIQTEEKEKEERLGLRNNLKFDFGLVFPLEDDDDTGASSSSSSINSNKPGRSFLSDVLVPFCLGGQQIVLAEQQDWGVDGVLGTYRKVTSEFNQRMKLHFQKHFKSLAEHESRERQRISKNEELPRSHIVQAKRMNEQRLVVELIKFSELVSGSGPLAVWVDPKGDEVLNNFSRIPQRCIARILLEKGVFAVECVAGGAAGKKRLRYRCAKGSSEQQKQQRFDRLSDALALPDEILFSPSSSVPRDETCPDYLLRIGAWVREEEDCSLATSGGGGVIFYNKNAPQATTWNIRRNWCLPRGCWDDSGGGGGGMSMCFQPSTAQFGAASAPSKPKSEVSPAAAGGAAAASVADSVSASGLLPSSSSAALGMSPSMSIALGHLFLDAAGNTYEKDDDGNITLCEDNELNWVLRSLLQPSGDDEEDPMWRLVIDDATKQVNFEFVVTNSVFEDMGEALGIPEIVTFSDHGATAALLADQVWVRAEDENQDEYFYNVNNSNVVWTIDEMFFPQ